MALFARQWDFSKDNASIYIWAIYGLDSVWIVQKKNKKKQKKTDETNSRVWLGNGHEL